jgi:dTDP-4-dehydrorhamnose reductase
MSSVLLLGASGLLGSHLAARLPASLPTFAALPREGEPDRQSGIAWLSGRLDANNPASVEGVLEEAGADVVVNAIGVQSGERHHLEAINARFPRELASLLDRRGGRLIHISTDGVFSGTRGGYTESDPPDPNDDYGRTKLAGEPNAPHLTIRASFFGRSPRSGGLVEWLLTQTGRTVEGYADYSFSGVSAAVLADLLAAAILAPAILEGVYHVGGEPTTKFELLKAIVDRLELDVKVVPVHRRPIDRTLNASRFFHAIGGRPPALAESVAHLAPCASCRELSHN